MKDHFSVEFQINEGEKELIIEKLRNYFLKEGYIIQRESNSQIDFYKPMPSLRKEEKPPHLWINKIQLAVDGTQVKLICFLNRFKFMRFITIVLVPITEITLAGVFYLLKISPIIVILFLLSGIISPIVGYFVFRLVYTHSIEYFGNEIQKIVG